MQVEPVDVTVAMATADQESVVEDSVVVMVTEEEQEHMRDDSAAVRIQDVRDGEIDQSACRYHIAKPAIELDLVGHHYLHSHLPEAKGPIVPKKNIS
jgi:hypothetical protein